MTDTETPTRTPEELAAYQARFLPDAPPVTVDGLRRHAATFGAYMVAETAWEHGLVAPVPPAPVPTAPRPGRRRR